jgi:hypothetical protein
MTTGFIILVVLILLAIWIYVKVAAIPGKTARERSHPQAEAINVLGWVGLLLGVVPWLIALIWAYTKPITIVTIPATDSPDPQPVPTDTKAGV